MENIDEFLEKYISMLPTEGAVSDSEAQRRASELLVAQSHLAAYHHSLTNDLIKFSSLKDVEYAKALNLAEGSDATKRKANAEAMPDYIDVREKFEEIENKMGVVRTYLDIFKNGHVMYRQMASGLKEGF